MGKKKMDVDKILRILNEDFSDDILDDHIIVDGFKFSCSEDVSSHSIDVSERLFGEDIENGIDVEYTRTGYKIISYGHWTETHWYDWE
jgi:hypothetical protein